MTKNHGFGLYARPIVLTLNRYGPSSKKELKPRCDSYLGISQSDSSFYRCLRGLKHYGFVQKTDEIYELTSSGQQLATATTNEDSFRRFLQARLDARQLENNLRLS